METRTADFGAVVDLFRRRQRTSRSSCGLAEKVRQRFRSQEIQRPGDFLRQPAGEIRPRADGAVRLSRRSPRQKPNKKQALGTSASTTHIRGDAQAGDLAPRERRKMVSTVFRKTFRD